MNLRPLDDRIVVRQEEAKTETDGGIVLPDEAQQRQRRGTVLAVGPGRILQDGSRAQVSVDSGDEIIFSEYGGSYVDVDGEELIIIQEMDVMAVVLT